MPKYSGELESIRIIEVMQTLRLMIYNGTSKTAACAEMGITPDIFDRWINSVDADGVSAIEVLQETIVEAERARIATYAQMETAIVSRLVDLIPFMRSEDLLKTLKLIAAQRKELELLHSLTRKAGAADQYLLTGPETRVEESKMVSFNVNPRGDGSVDITVTRSEDIIDSTFDDPEANSDDQPEDHLEES